jgi:hypothetical protein
MTTVDLATLPASTPVLVRFYGGAAIEEVGVEPPEYEHVFTFLGLADNGESARFGGDVAWEAYRFLGDGDGCPERWACGSGADPLTFHAVTS